MCIRDRDTVESDSFDSDYDDAAAVTPEEELLTAVAGGGTVVPVSYTHLAPGDAVAIPYEEATQPKPPQCGKRLTVSPFKQKPPLCKGCLLYTSRCV